MEEGPGICYHFDKLNKKKLITALQEWSQNGACYKNHSKTPTPKNPELRISLVTYKIACSSNTENKCMFKDYEEDKNNCIALTPTSGLIWYRSNSQ